VLISEIINSNLRAKINAKAVRKRKVAIKGPYAPPPKTLPKPKPPKLTPLQLKKKQQSNLQAYAKAVQNTLRNTSSSTNARQPPVQYINTADNINPNRDDHEKEAFLKQLRGESP
jgi:isocitrate dehydrogenase